MLPSGITVNYRDQIIATALRHRIPAIFPERSFAESGGLVSYGVVQSEMYRLATSPEVELCGVEQEEMNGCVEP